MARPRETSPRRVRLIGSTPRVRALSMPDSERSSSATLPISPRRPAGPGQALDKIRLGGHWAEICMGPTSGATDVRFVRCRNRRACPGQPNRFTPPPRPVRRSGTAVGGAPWRSLRPSGVRVGAGTPAGVCAALTWPPWACTRSRIPANPVHASPAEVRDDLRTTAKSIGGGHVAK